jgi:signal transduction histidine kinase
LYYSSFISGEYYITIVEADQNYFNDAVGFRNAIIFNTGILVIVCFILLVSIYVIDRQSQKALALASHNERLAFLGRISAELAHELKNPLAIIKSSIDVLRNTYDEKRNNKVFIFISDEIMRLSNMITNILSFSKNTIDHKEQFFPKAIADTLIKNISDMFPEVTIHNNISESLKLIGDSQLFHQVADNILRNSVTAMKGKGLININSRQNKKKYTLIFTDTGPGIPNSLKNKIFDPFVTQSKTGTGLGLAIVKSICNKSDWEINLISNSRGKTAFAINIKESLWVKS